MWDTCQQTGRAVTVKQDSMMTMIMEVARKMNISRQKGEFHKD